jgi:hypothetical protein
VKSWHVAADLIAWVRRPPERSSLSTAQALIMIPASTLCLMIFLPVIGLGMSIKMAGARKIRKGIARARCTRAIGSVML